MGPQSATITLDIEGEHKTDPGDRQRPGRRDLNAIKALVPHEAVLELYQVSAVTEGTDAQAEVSVRLQAGRQDVHRPRRRHRHAGRFGQGLRLALNKLSAQRDRIHAQAQSA